MMQVNDVCDDMFYENLLEFLDTPGMNDEMNIFDDFSDYSSEGLVSEDSSVNMMMLPSSSTSRKR